MNEKTIKMKNGMLVHYASADDVKGMFEKVYLQETYGKHGIELKQSNVVYDVGANIGLVSIWLGQQTPGLEIHSFEPVGSTFAKLAKNLAIHAPEATPHQFGIGAHAQDVEFIHYPHMAQMSTMYDEHDAKTRRLMEDGMVKSYFKLVPLPLALVFAVLPLEKWKRGFARLLLNHILRSVRVKGRIESLSGTMDKLGTKHIDLLKINAQGSEADILENTPLPYWNRVRQLIVETHQDQDVVKKLVSLLQARGYQVSVQQEDLVGTDSINILFARRPAAN